MEAFDFPPFELDKYRIIYLEKTESIVKCTVGLDRTIGGDVDEALEIYDQHEAEVTELVLRLLLLEETYGKTDVALPDGFLIKHDCYTLSVATVPWTTPQRFRFFRRHAHPSLKSSDPCLVVDYERLVCWPFKYRFTFTPHSATGLQRGLQNERTLMPERQIADQGPKALVPEQMSVDRSTTMSDILAERKDATDTRQLQEAIAAVVERRHSQEEHHSKDELQLLW